MSITVINRFRSGEVCPHAGRYTFDGYVDGTWDPEPPAELQSVRLSLGEHLPRIPGTGKPCWWVIVEEGESPLDEVQKMIAEGGPLIQAV